MSSGSARRATFGLALLALAHGCGGSGTPTVRGTAASGAPLAAAAVTLKDRNGTVRAATTDAAGAYAVDVTGLLAPFLVKVDDPGAPASYLSVGFQAGVVNLTPLTDLLVEECYALQGLDAAAVFAALGPASVVPTPDQIALLAALLERTLEIWLVQAGLDPDAFDFVTSPFAADGSGADGLLDRTAVVKAAGPDTVTVADGTTTTTAILTPDAATASLTADAVTSNASGTTTSRRSTRVPVTAGGQAALDGVEAAVGRFVSAVNGGGLSLSAAQILPLTDLAFLDRGRDRVWFAGELASTLRGATLSNPRIEAIRAYDPIAETMEVSVRATVSGGGLSARGTLPFIYKRDAGTMSWLLFGDQRIAEIDLQVVMSFDTDAMGTTAAKSVLVQVKAVKDAVVSVSVTDGTGTIFSATPLVKSGTPERVEFTPAPGGPATQIERDVFSGAALGLLSFPPVGTVFTFTLTPAVGPPVMVDVVTRGNTTEQTAVTAPSGHALADASLGGTLVAAWTRPTTFVPAFQAAGVVLRSMSFSRTVSPDDPLLPTASGASFTLPATLTMELVTSATLSVGTFGPTGERILLLHQFE